MAYPFASTAPRMATFTLVLSRDGPVSGFSLTRSQASVLCVMGGRQRLLGDACLPTCTRAPALRVMIYGRRGWGLNHKLTGRGGLY
jgi:hypothetical protein